MTAEGMAPLPEPLPRTARGWVRLWFSTHTRVTRRAYLVSGFGLATLKFAVDWSVVQVFVGKSLDPFFYVTPLLADRLDALSPAPSWLAWAMAFWTLPFLWIATSMSLRRAVDAGWSPWVGLTVVLPVVNLVMIAVLSLPRSRPRVLEPPARRRRRGAEDPSGQPAWATRHEDIGEPGIDTLPRQAMVSVVVGVACGIGMVAFSTLVLRAYGSVLFLGTPILLGAVCGFIANVPQPRPLGATLRLVTWSTLIAGLGLIAFALEGAVCLIIIAPMVLPLAVLGGMLGRAMALSIQPLERSGPHEQGRVFRVCGWLVLLPLMATAEHEVMPAGTFEVVSHIEIDAPPEVVWKHVVSFSELPEPTGLLFRWGVAHPRRARIEGHGVGAIRHCEFSTGPFVEPITVWDEPHRLAFDVTEQPVPMHEWSPYTHLHPPHLDETIRSIGGEFRLVPLPGGRTRLEGSTWYELDLFPQLYFRAWADHFIHDIHMQVLEHVARLSAREMASRR